MASFGSALKEAFENATESAKEAFNATSQAVSDTGEYIAEQIVDGAAYAKDKAVEGAIYAKDKVVEGATYVKDKTVEGAIYVKDKTVEGATYVRDKAIDGAVYTRDKVVAAKEHVLEYLEPKPAGQKIESCPLAEKADRVKLRREKIAKAKEKIANMKDGKDKDVLENATERFEFNNHAVERARLADSVYSIGQEAPPEGWERPTAQDIEALGLDPKEFPQFKKGFKPEEHKDGYFVELYKTDPKVSSVLGGEQYVLVFRGTQGTEDWKTNAKQGFGEDTEHYSKAISLAKKAHEKLGDRLEISGHSLGGGIATAAGITSGTKTFAYNPAGVHPGTLERIGDFSRDDAFNLVNGRPLVDNVVVPGEILTAVQNPIFQKATLATAVVGSSVASPYAGGAVTGAAANNRATVEQGTISYGMTGVRHDVPLLGNAKEVAEATARGDSIQGMTPSKPGEVNAAINPVKKVDMHGMHSVIAGIEQQKADDMYQIDRGIK